jgi:hypothetical protein
MTRQTETPEVDVADSGRSDAVYQAIRWMSWFAGTPAVLTAAAVYSGWIDIHAKLRQFGIAAGVARLSALEYAVIGAGILTKPVVVFSVAVYFTFKLRNYFRRKTRVPARLLTWIRAGARIIGLSLLIAGLLGLFDKVIYNTRYAIPPVFVAIGILLIWYVDDAPERSRGPRSKPSPTGSMLTLLMLVTLLGCACWIAVAHTRVTAGEQAKEEYLRERPLVFVSSKDPLDLPTSSLIEGGRIFPYRYRGLRLLVYADETYFLVPDEFLLSKERKNRMPSTVLVTKSPRTQISLQKAD